MNPTVRLLALVALLRGRHEPLSFEAIRAALAPVHGYDGSLAAARRRFERDKRALCDLGLPLTWDAARSGYLLDPAWRRPRTLALSASDLDTIREAAELAAGDPGSPMAADARGAVERLLALARDEAYRAPTARVLAHHPDLDPPEVRERVQRLVQACHRRLPVACTYQRTRGGRRQRRRIDPWGLFAREGRWCLVGRCHTRDARRVFLVAQMEGLRVEGLPDAPPRFERPVGFDLRAEADQSPWDWDAHEPEEARLAVDAELAPLLTRRLGGDVREVARTAEGAPILARTVSNADALFEIATAWLPRVRPLAPARLAAAWRAHAAAVAAAHAGRAP